jgi:hypothetical protein
MCSSMIRKTLAILFTVVGLTTLSIAQDKRSTPELPRLTFSDLKRNDSIAGAFIIVGSVVQIYNCPPCPPGMQCKPCLGDYLVITDNLDEKDPLLIRRLRVFTRKPEQFELRKKVSFVAKIRGKVPKGKPIEDLNFIEMLLDY